MSLQGKMRRCYLILRILQTRHYPKLDEIHDYLHDHGFEITQRTLQRDLESIRTEFDVDIAYDPGQRGYKLEAMSGEEIEVLMQFFKSSQTANILLESIKGNREHTRLIQVEQNEDYIGLEYIQPLLNAIKERRIVKFTYYNYVKDRIKDYVLKPYLLKEFKNRWYIIGQQENISGSYTFGLERILKMEISKQSFETDPSYKPESLFENTIGLNYSAGKPCRVILHFHPEQGRYIKSLPLHHSQKILEENKQYLAVELFVVPNYELREIILTYGEKVKVLEPKSLQKQIKQSLARAAKQYD